MAFQTKAGKALAAAFDPEQRDAIKQPDSAARGIKLEDGTILPIDRTAEGVVYHGDKDERLGSTGRKGKGLNYGRL